MSKREVKDRLQALVFWIVAALIGLALLAAAAWGIWRAMQQVPANTARLWALAVTALLPVVTWIGWHFGHTEARGRLAGIDDAIDKVMGGATKIAGLGLRTQRARSAPPREPEGPGWEILPQVEIVERRQLTSGEDVVEL